LGGAGNALTANATTGTISYPITVTSGGGSFVSSPSAGGSITGTSEGTAQTASLTGTVAYANVTPVTAGIYGGTVTLTITY
jgi:spore coat protein U-like protein